MINSEVHFVGCVHVMYLINLLKPICLRDAPTV